MALRDSAPCGMVVSAKSSDKERTRRDPNSFMVTSVVQLVYGTNVWYLCECSLTTMVCLFSVAEMMREKVRGIEFSEVNVNCEATESRLQRFQE